MRRLLRSLLVVKGREPRNIQPVRVCERTLPVWYRSWPGVEVDGGTYSGQLGSLCLLFIEVSPLWNAEERLGRSRDLMDRIVAGRCNDPVCRTQKLRQIIDPSEFAQVAKIRFMSLAVDGACDEPQTLGFCPGSHG